MCVPGGSKKVKKQSGLQLNDRRAIATMSKPGPKSKLTQTHHAGVYKADSVKVRDISLSRTPIETVYRMSPSLWVSQVFRTWSRLHSQAMSSTEYTKSSRWALNFGHEHY